jgi:hypothetical protein
MKKIFLAILSGVIVTTFSCTKDLNQTPISSTTLATFYSQPSDFIQATNAIYNGLMAYPDRQLNLSETRSDNVYGVSDGGVRDWEGINDFFTTISSNVYVSEAWTTNFNAIYKANVLLDQLQKNGSVITDATLKLRLEAEAKFLRAFYYFDLVRWFGKVPVIDHPVTADEAFTIQRSPVADVYKLIISDLQFAATNLPDAYTTATDKGRATKYAAKGILALVYMTRSAPTYNIEGPGLGLNEWSTAYGLLNEIISSGKYSFLSSYASIFSYTNENNAEVIFDVEYTTGLSPVVGGTFPWVLVPDTWFQANGKAVQGGLTIRPVAVDLLNSYAATDVRKAFSIQSGYVYNGVAETRSFFKKYVDLTKVPTNRVDWPINFIVMRYTDVLLLKAECVLHSGGGSQSEVDAAVNQVRIRAGLTALTNVSLQQLMDERRKEFAAEGSRWHDLVRSGNIITTINNWIGTEDVQKAMKQMTANSIIYPIPQSQLDAKPGFYVQNPGYN